MNTLNRSTERIIVCFYNRSTGSAFFLLSFDLSSDFIHIQLTRFA